MITTHFWNTLHKNMEYQIRKKYIFSRKSIFSEETIYGPNNINIVNSCYIYYNHEETKRKHILHEISHLMVITKVYERTFKEIFDFNNDGKVLFQVM